MKKKKKKEIRIREKERKKEEKKKERRKKKKEGRLGAAGLHSESLSAWVTALHLTQPDPVLQAVPTVLMKGLPLRLQFPAFR
jgi:hypothetical protein